ncbi:thioredoxin family protein [Chitinophaga pendula]|uniref:thioredoxin family protein n=1 Tax=Chitinophaga TaxID=79328 RepID=UPI000BB04F13|nr:MULTISPECIES: thioredoxin family protein [Chitinophaga]ASZ10047.1 hypothetical protein CK934_03160 [Chitinophaga sp. MD30]UCJ07002.1 thioredoxin family protein [Chitinophaga pendula]
MRLKTLLLGGGLLFSSFAWAQDGAKELKGKIELKTLMSDNAYAWFYTGVNKYQPNDAMVNYIKSNRTGFNIVAVVNTTDESSRKLLPQLYKVMILAGNPEQQVLLFGADNKLDTGAPIDYKIKKVPTFIVMKDGKEQGRISGDVTETVESDLARILLKMNKKDKE